MGFLLVLIIVEEEYDYMVNFLGLEFFLVNKLLIDELRIIIDIKIEYGGLNGFCSVLCLNGENIWICGCDKIIRFFNFKGEIVKFI